MKLMRMLVKKTHFFVMLLETMNLSKIISLNIKSLITEMIVRMIIQ